MRVVAISDLHGFLPPVPRCDLLLVGGDLCPLDDHDVAFQGAWLAQRFAAWLRDAPARRIVGIAGNHDFVAALDRDLLHALPWTYLEDGGTEAFGLRIWGTPWTPTFGDWAFMDAEERLAERWRDVPEGLDVLLCHGPPEGYGVTVKGDDAGSTALLEAVRRAAPRICLYGHIHEAQGTFVLGPTTLANVSHVDERYAPVHPPHVCELEPAARRAWSQA